MKYETTKVLTSALLFLAFSSLVAGQTSLPIEKETPATSTSEVQYTELRLSHDSPEGVNIPDEWFFRLDSWAYDGGESSQGIVSVLGIDSEISGQTALHRGNASLGVNTAPYVNERSSSNPLHLTEWALVTEFENGEVCAWYQENCFQVEQETEEKRTLISNAVDEVGILQKDIDRWRQNITANITVNSGIQDIPAVGTQSKDKYQASIIVETGTGQKVISSLSEKTDNNIRIQGTHSASYTNRKDIVNTWEAENICIRLMGVELKCQDFQKPEREVSRADFETTNLSVEATNNRGIIVRYTVKHTGDPENLPEGNIQMPDSRYRLETPVLVDGDPLARHNLYFNQGDQVYYGLADLTEGLGPRFGDSVKVTILNASETAELRSGESSEENRNTYSTVEAEKVTDYIGGAVQDIRAKTEIRFGNQLQNSLYIHSIEGDYLREAEIKLSAQTRDSENKTLSYDNMVQGLPLKFASGRYTVHMCGDSSMEELKISLSKRNGTNGYGACFTEKEAQETSFNRKEYSTGEVTTVQKGDVLAFGPGNRNLLFYSGATYSRNIDRYSLNAYANRLTEHKKVRPVQGTSMDAYFYTGLYSVHFCSYQDQKARITVTEGSDISQACNSEVQSPDGTIELQSSQYPVNTPIPVTADINSEGDYRLKAAIRGEEVSSTRITSTGTTEITPETTGNMTVKLVAPGSWWNPLDSSRTVSEKTVEIHSVSENPDENQSNRTETPREVTINAPSSPEKGETASTVIETNGQEEYQVVIKGPDGETKTDQTFSGSRETVRTDIDSAGNYTVSIYPTGAIQSIVSAITGPIAQKKFTVPKEGSDRPAWKTYCINNGHSIEKLGSQVTCIEQEIIPNFFDSDNENLEIPESLCSDLLNYSYSRQEQACTQEDR